MRRRLLRQDDDSDPMSVVSNLFDVAMVFAVALMVALVSRYNMTEMFSKDDFTMVKNPGKENMEIITKEGEKIKNALGTILEKINEITLNIEKIFETLPEKLKEKLLAQIKSVSDDISISEDRLAQEIVLMVTRADIKEEIDRLKTHIKSAYNLLESDEAVGRRLDFLCQELNREANTTCSKASDIAITNMGMELKALIEQFREQVQNIE